MPLADPCSPLGAEVSLQPVAGDALAAVRVTWVAYDTALASLLAVTGVEIIMDVRRRSQ